MKLDVRVATALERIVSTIGLGSNPAAGLDFDANVICPAAAGGFPPTSGRRDRAADRPRRRGKRSAAGPVRRRRAQPSSASRTLGTASGSGSAESWFFPAGTSLVPGAPRAQVDRRNCPHAPDRLTRSASHSEIRFSVMLRGVASWKNFTGASRSGRAIWPRTRTRSPSGGYWTWPSDTISRADREPRAVGPSRRRARRHRRRCFPGPANPKTQSERGPAAGFRYLHRAGRVLTPVLASPGAISAAAFRISATRLLCRSTASRCVVDDGKSAATKLVQWLIANRLSKIKLSLRRSSHGSATRSSMVSCRVFGGDR
jgi:hypothetical protein